MRRERRARLLGVPVDQIHDGRGRHGNHARGRANGKWNGGRMLSSHGYVLVKVGRSHPLAFGTGYAYEHDLVWVTAHGPLPLGHLVHHKNGDKTDNRLENLEALTREEHGRHHIEERPRDAAGRVL